MSVAATIDLHWEVKKKALEFWQEIIWHCLQNQGMIDGQFPEVTFSKADRKIVTLNEHEIRRRLSKVLVELSKNGCLEVLMVVIQDDCDIDVVVKAVDVTKTIVALLNEYKVFVSENENFIINCEDEKVKRFVKFAQQDLDKIVENKRKWMKNLDGFGSVLDDILRDYEDDEDINTMDCY